MSADADLLAALGTLADEICAALRGFDGEPGHPGEFISVNEAQGIVRETVAAHQHAEPERCAHVYPDGTRCTLTDHSAPGLAEVHAPAHRSERTDTAEAEGSGYCPDTCTWPHAHRFERDGIPWPARGSSIRISQPSEPERGER